MITILKCLTTPYVQSSMIMHFNIQSNRMDTLLQQLTRGNALLLIIILGFGGSFQNGFHLVAVSSPSPFIQSFINSSWYDRYDESPPPQTVTMIWSLVVSIYAVGGFCGSSSVKFITGKFGRKKAMLWNSIVAVVAAGIMLTSRSAKSYEMIIVARLLFGYSAGLGINTHMMYLGEIAPRKIRGSVTLSSATFGSLGKLFGQTFGLSELLGREELWHILLCVPAFFSVVQLIVLPFLPEAPRYLFIEKGDENACKKALRSLWGKGEYKQEMDEMRTEQAAIEAAPPKSPLQLLRDRTVRWQLLTMSIIFASNHMSGMSAISTFSFDIFLKAGIPRDYIRYVIVGLGVSEIITSISTGLLVEHTGRRPLFWGGYGSMSAIWVLVTVTLNLKDSTYWVPYITVGLIVLFIISFSGGPGSSTSTLLTELFIQSDRVAAFVLMGFQRWAFAAIMSFGFPFIIDALDSYCFVLFACVCLLASLYTFFIVPETKGKTLLEISEEFKAITVCGKSFSKEKIVETKL